MTKHGGTVSFSFKWFWSLSLAFALPLLGAAPSGYTTPVVVVYPLTTSGDLAKSQAGPQIAVLLASRLAQIDALTIKPPTPGTQRADYLSAAQQEGADYYVTGFLAPVGAEVSIIVQVVSTTSGTIVYSSSQMARTFGDAVGNADDISAAIVGHAGRALASLDAPPPPSPSPTPGAKNGVGFNLSNLLKRHKTSKPKPKPVPSAAPVALASPSPHALATTASTKSTAVANTGSVNANSTSAPRAATVTAALPASSVGARALVIATGGSASDDERLRASEALIAALSRAGIRSAPLPVSAQTVATHAKDLCAANPGAATFYSGTLALAPDAKGSANVEYDVTAYDCAGTVVRQQHLTEHAPKRGGVDAAIVTVASRAATAFSRSLKS